MRLSRTGVRLTPSAAASSFSDSAAPGGSSSVRTFRRRVSYTTRRLVRGRTTAAMSFIVVHNTVELVWQSLDLLLDRCLYTSTAGQALEQSRECDPWTRSSGPRCSSPDRDGTSSPCGSPHPTG